MPFRRLHSLEEKICGICNRRRLHPSITSKCECLRCSEKKRYCRKSECFVRKTRKCCRASKLKAIEKSTMKKVSIKKKRKKNTVKGIWLYLVNEGPIYCTSKIFVAHRSSLAPIDPSHKMMPPCITSWFFLCLLLSFVHFFHSSVFVFLYSFRFSIPIDNIPWWGFPSWRQCDRFNPIDQYINIVSLSRLFFFCFIHPFFLLLLVHFVNCCHRHHHQHHRNKHT